MFHYDIREMRIGEPFSALWKFRGVSLAEFEVPIPWEDVDEVVCHHWAPEDDEILDDDEAFYAALNAALATGSISPEAIEAINDEIDDVVNAAIRNQVARLGWDPIGIQYADCSSS
jgi:hypothetical protein